MKPFLSHIRSLAVFVCVLFSFQFSFAQYSTQGPLSGSVFSDDNSIGDFSFSSPGNAVSSDNSRSSASALLTLLNGNTHYLKVTGFGISIPLLATVTGIKVEIEKSAIGINVFATVKDNEIKLVKGNVPVGDNKALSSSWNGTEDYDSYGDTTDTWGTTWTPAEVNASDFGVVVSAKIAGLLTLLPSARIDHIRVTVFYIVSLPIHFLDFKITTKNENKVLLEWTTADNDEKALFTVQRSTDALNWTDMQTIPGITSFSTKKYYYTDYISNINCRFYYRIKMTLLSGAALYTKIVFADVRKQEEFILFPNPATSDVYISFPAIDQINLFSVSGNQIKVGLEKTNDNHVKINLSSLPPGFYVVKAGDKKKQLLIR